MVVVVYYSLSTCMCVCIYNNRVLEFDENGGKRNSGINMS